MKLGLLNDNTKMTPSQMVCFSDLLNTLRPTEFFFGDDRKADEQAYKIVAQVNPPIKVSVLPLSRRMNRAMCKADFVAFPSSITERNEALVSQTDVLVAIALRRKEQATLFWKTVESAIAADKPVFIFFPDGRTATEV